MTFTPNIPTTGQSLGNTRDMIRNNFTNYNDVVSVNHVAPNDPNQGKHNFLQMPDQAAAPTTAANELGLYSKDVAGNSRLFLRQENNGAEIQMSGINPVANINGNTFLPGGILMQWGTESIPANTTFGIINFPITFSKVYQVQVSYSQKDRMLSVININNAFFEYYYTNTSTSSISKLYYLAIGSA